MKKLWITVIAAVLCLTACGKSKDDSVANITPDIYTDIEPRTYTFESSEGGNVEVGDIYSGDIDLSKFSKKEDSIGEREYYSADGTFLGLANTQDVSGNDDSESYYDVDQDTDVEDSTSDSTTENNENFTMEFEDSEEVATVSENVVKTSLDNNIVELETLLKNNVENYKKESSISEARSIFSFKLIECDDSEYGLELVGVETSDNGILLVYHGDYNAELVLMETTPELWDRMSYSVDQVTDKSINEVQLEYAQTSGDRYYAKWETDEAVYVCIAANCGEVGFDNILREII